MQRIIKYSWGRILINLKILKVRIVMITIIKVRYLKNGNILVLRLAILSHQLTEVEKENYVKKGTITLKFKAYITPKGTKILKVKTVLMIFKYVSKVARPRKREAVTSVK